MIELSQISFSYKNNPIFKNLNYTFKESTVLIGKNGCGKSTLLKILAGIQKPDIGFSKKPSLKITWQPATSHLKTSLHVDEFIEIYFDGRPIKEKQNAKSFLESFFGFTASHKPMNQCSSGEIQMVLLSCSLHTSADLILLDEPLSYLDTKAKIKTAKHLKDHQTPSIITSHESWLVWSIFEHCTILHDSQLLSIDTIEDYLSELQNMTGHRHQSVGSFVLPSEGI